MQTFLAKSDTLSALTSVDFNITASLAMEERNPHRAHFALFNTTGSNKIVNIREISVTPFNWSGTLINTQKIVPITAHAGGTPVTTIGELDSNNASFPATIEIRTNVPQATVATGSLARVQRSPNALLGVTLGYTVQWKNASLYSWRDATTAETQKYLLRNGEGIAIQESNAPALYNFPIEINAQIRLSDTGACYFLTTFADAGQPFPFTILNNGYTAGQVEILNITFNTVRGGPTVASTADNLPYFQVAILEGYNATNNGTVITPISMDSTNSLNSNIKLYKDLDIGYFYSRTGNQAVNTLFLRTVAPTSVQATPLIAPQKQCLYKSIAPETSLVVREGSGIAVLLPATGTFNSSYYIDVVFTQQTSYPETSDVRLGTEYGVGTGTLVVGGGGFVSILNE